MTKNDDYDDLTATDQVRFQMQFKSGHLESFLPLVTPFLPNIRLTAYSIVRNRDDMDEVVQETMIKAFSNIHQLRQTESLKAWLLRIAVNEALMYRRKYRPHLFVPFQHESEVVDEFRPKEFVDWRNLPFTELEQQEIRTALADALNSLPDGYREVFVLRDVQQLSAQETGELLEMSEAAVNTRLHRARLRLREMLTPLFRGEKRRWAPMSLKMAKLMGKRFLRKTISCRHVVREISNYINGAVSAALKAEIEKHLEICDRCSAILDSTRKLLYIASEQGVFAVPFTCNENWKALLQETRNPHD